MNSTVLSSESASHVRVLLLRALTRLRSGFPRRSVLSLANRYYAVTKDTSWFTHDPAFVQAVTTIVTTMKLQQRSTQQEAAEGADYTFQRLVRKGMARCQGVCDGM